GGMGVVYKAEDTKLKRIVALKFLPSDLLRNEEAKKRLTLEAQAASALDHNNICTIHEINETEDGQLYIAMANYDGETLETKIEQKQLSFENTIDIIIQVAQGLSKAHETGIVHRDVKPSNIMITNDGVVKILDFGLAKLSNHPKLTKKGSTLGTVAYMSPEQIQGEEVDRRADIWAIGVILYEMITGQLPFKGEYDQAIIYSILNESPESISNLRTELPPRIEQILTKCISKKKEARYQNVNEMMADLRLLKQQMEFPIISPKPTVETTSRSSKSSLVIIVASIVIVVLSSLLFWVFV
ncbi:MAG: protein kinase, partial [Aliifodinibius sp.]|nr:serine/threonine protein kinase [Fodinibius sp.]NIV16276.1 protein kinase [Fodinibius sp.]NIW95186.1 protein kinase [Phycisphaerae bacterium]NIY30233.1 protein kinase [Fodinibius sp.]